MKDDELVPVSETLVELALPGLRALAERLSVHIEVTERHGSGIRADVERWLLANRRRELTLCVACAMLESVAPPGSGGNVIYAGYLPREAM